MRISLELIFLRNFLDHEKVQKPLQRVSARPLTVTTSLSGYEHKHEGHNLHMNPGYMGFGGKVLGKTKHAPKLRRSW